MKKKRGMIAAVCIALSFLLLLGLFSVIWWIARHADNLQFGGLVGELLEQQKGVLLVPDNENDPSMTDASEELPTIDEQTTLEVSTTPSEPEGSPTLRFFLSGCNSWIGESMEKTFKHPNNSLHWDHRAVIDDPRTDTVRVWGWAAVFEDIPLQVGYRIDGGESIYDDASEFTDADQASTTAALGMGAVSATGISVKIPIEHLNGTHTIEIMVRPLGGKEGVICTFEIDKTQSPATSE